jgi:amino acid transporter
MLKKLIADPLFVRVCIFFWGAGFALCFAAVPFLWGSHIEERGVAVAALTITSILGLFMLCIAVFGSDSSIQTVSSFTNSLDIVGFLFFAIVAIVALPVTALIRAYKPALKK